MNKIVKVCLQRNGDVAYWNVDCSSMQVRFASIVEFGSTSEYWTGCDLLLYADKDLVDFDKASKAFSHVVDYNEFLSFINSSCPCKSIHEFKDMLIWNYLNISSSVYDNVYRFYGSKETAEQEATNKYPVSSKFTGSTPLTTKEK